MIGLCARLALATALSLTAAPAFAQEDAVRTARDAIAAGNYARAEQLLTTERRIFPNRAEVLVNLAAVYARTGRTQQASALYRQVLASDAVLLDLSIDRTRSSHAIAEAGLRRLVSYQTAAK